MSVIRTVHVATQGLESVLPLLEVLLPDVAFKLITFENAVPGDVKVDIKLTEQDLKSLHDAEILITDNFVIGQLLYQLPKLKWLQACYNGIDSAVNALTPDVVSQSGLPAFVLTRFSGDLYANLMFEYCFCFIVNLERGFLNQICEKKSCSWSLMRSFAPKSYRLVHELTIAVLGAGSIGTRVARNFQRLGSRTTVYGRRERSSDEIRASGLDSYSNCLEDVIANCDYIISILPHTPATTGLLNGKFASCRKSPVFINLGRGSVVGTEYLIQSLDEGIVSYAVLDVFEQEPLPEDNPLWKHEKVSITPHVSCITRPEDVAKVFVDNFHLFVNNKPMNDVVDWRQLY